MISIVSALRVALSASNAIHWLSGGEAPRGELARRPAVCVHDEDCLLLKAAPRRWADANEGDPLAVGRVLGLNVKAGIGHRERPRVCAVDVDRPQTRMKTGCVWRLVTGIEEDPRLIWRPRCNLVDRHPGSGCDHLQACSVRGQRGDRVTSLFVEEVEGDLPA